MFYIDALIYISLELFFILPLIPTLHLNSSFNLFFAYSSNLMEFMRKVLGIIKRRRYWESLSAAVIGNSRSRKPHRKLFSQAVLGTINVL